MSTIEHIVAPEDLMAFLDGELAPERTVSVRAHLAECALCQSVAADLRAVSDEMRVWEVEAAAEPLRAPAVAARRRRPGLFFSGDWSAAARQAAAAAGVVVALGAAMWMFESRVRQSSAQRADQIRNPVPDAMSVSVGRSSAGGRAAVAEPSLRQAQDTVPSSTVDPRGPQIVRTATLTIVTRDFAAIRPAVDRILRDVGGFVGSIQVSGETTAGSLRGTLRVPANRLADTLAALRALGRVTDETQTGEDVSEQVRDLEARLVNSRNTEKRLTEVLRNRTGDVSDVLQVEREIARVREEIERMDAERANLARRVSYATITLQVDQERQATLDMGPQPMSTKFRNAIVDGVRDAFESVVGLALWLLRVGPMLLVWGLLLWWPVRFAIRRGRDWTAPAA
jgi:hypothetical protein